MMFLGYGCKDRNCWAIVVPSIVEVREYGMFHRHQEWIKILKKIDAQTDPTLDLHLIVDNYATLLMVDTLDHRG
jgi:hypothetical protein